MSNENDEAWVKDYPVTVMQFLLYLYHNQPDFVPLCMSADFLTALSSTLFAYKIAAANGSESNSDILSPLEDFKVCTEFRVQSYPCLFHLT